MKSNLFVIWVLVLGVFALASVSSAPQAELWPRWEQHDAESTISVDHSLWQEFLDQYLIAPHPSGVNRVPYSAIDSDGQELLDRYIAMLRSQSPDDLNRSEQLPYWINLYNALTVRLIVDNLPLDSIRDIRDPWDTPVIEIEGIDLTLNDIEHRIVRPIWNDNRIHYVVNCASIGCPNLHPEALTAANYNRIADEAARAYIAHPRGASLERNRLRLSSIFNWYSSDFGSTPAEVLSHIAEYAPADLATEIRRYDGRIRYDYDWALNDGEL